jgi:tripartite-type tricarboxylate transporter receptor subunit TctC
LYFKKDLLRINTVSAPTALLSSVVEEAPTCKAFGVALWTALAAEIYFRPEGDEEGTKALKEDVQLFLKSGHTAVKMCKKDMPQDIVSKMEKFKVQECKTNLNLNLKDNYSDKPQ